MTPSIEIATLARLLETGSVRRADRNHVLIERFETARWIDPSQRKNEWCVRQGAILAIENRLEELLPAWTKEFEFLRSIERNPFDPNNIDALPSLKRQVTVSGMINRRNWNAATGLGPKHHARLPSQATLTKDWILRFRPNAGLRGMFSTKEVDFCEMASIFTECAIPERSWIKLQQFSGVMPNIIVSCENLGAYVDLPVDDSVLVVYAPGADTEAASTFLKSLPNVPWIHFGDFDPEGVAIAKNIALQAGREARMFIPSFTADYVAGAAPVKSPWSEIPELPLFIDLKRMKKRIFQEVLMLDDRLSGELAEICRLNFDDTKQDSQSNPENAVPAIYKITSAVLP